MVTRIYDWKNCILNVNVKEDEIEEIRVQLMSDDEVVDFVFKDGTMAHFDSSATRNVDVLSVCYVVSGAEAINAWLNYQPGQYMQESDFCIPVKRAREFCPGYVKPGDGVPLEVFTAEEQLEINEISAKIINFIRESGFDVPKAKEALNVCKSLLDKLGAFGEGTCMEE